MLITLDGLKDVLKFFRKDILQDIVDRQDALKLEPSDDDIPTINLTGNMPTSKDEVFCELDYVSKTHSFHAYVKSKIQGGISAGFSKKNFAIELFSDKGTSIPLNEEFRNWGANYKYVLKANYVDHLHARNIVNANLWANIVRSRKDFDDLPEELKMAPNLGAIDGFPVKVYVNGAYEGMYTWNIPKKAWMFNTNKSNKKHAVLQATVNDGGMYDRAINPCNFSAKWNGVDKDHWEIEEGKASDELTKSFNAIIDAIIQLCDNNTSASKKLELVLDINSAIDYFIFIEVIMGIDSLGRNLTCVTYDMNKWYITAYDLDSTWGLSYDGAILFDQFAKNILSVALNRYSCLWYVITNNYMDRVKKRYTELRHGALSYSNIESMFEKFLSVATEDIRIQDVISYPDIPNVTENTFYNLKIFIKKRLEYLDAEYMEVGSGG